jgi:hypothetical protein
MERDELDERLLVACTQGGDERRVASGSSRRHGQGTYHDAVL